MEDKGIREGKNDGRANDPAPRKPMDLLKNMSDEEFKKAWDEFEEKYKDVEWEGPTVDEFIKSGFGFNRSPDRSEDRSSLKEENEKLKKDNDVLKRFAGNDADFIEVLNNYAQTTKEKNDELEQEIERLRGDLALANDRTTKCAACYGEDNYWENRHNEAAEIIVDLQFQIEELTKENRDLQRELNERQ